MVLLIIMVMAIVLLIGVCSGLGFAWQAISCLGFVLSDFCNRMVLRDLTLVRFQYRLVMISFIIALTKRNLKAALQFLNWGYSASTYMSFSSPEKPALPFQKGSTSHKHVTFSTNSTIEFHVTEGHWYWSCCEIILSLVASFPAREISSLLLFLSGFWRLSSTSRNVIHQIEQLYFSLCYFCFCSCCVRASSAQFRFYVHSVVF